MLRLNSLAESLSEIAYEVTEARRAVLPHLCNVPAVPSVWHPVPPRVVPCSSEGIASRKRPHVETLLPAVGVAHGETDDEEEEVEAAAPQCYRPKRAKHTKVLDFHWDKLDKHGGVLPSNHVPHPSHPPPTRSPLLPIACRHTRRQRGDHPDHHICSR